MKVLAISTIKKILFLDREYFSPSRIHLGLRLVVKRVGEQDFLLFFVVLFGGNGLYPEPLFIFRFLWFGFSWLGVNKLNA